MIQRIIYCFFGLLFIVPPVYAERQKFVEFTSFYADIDVSKVKLGDTVWKKAKLTGNP